MNTSTDEKWRSGRPHNETRQSNQPRHSSGPREKNQQPHADRQGNRGPAMPRKEQNTANPQKNDKTAKNGTNSGPLRDEHVPVNGFNGREIEAELGKINEKKPMVYKLPKVETPKQGNAPWGIKSNAMANGRDFFLELRKQISAAQRAGGTALGG